MGVEGDICSPSGGSSLESIEEHENLVKNGRGRANLENNPL